MEKNQLKTVTEIFSEAWDLYKSKAVSIVLVAIISLLVSALVLVGGATAAFFALGGQPFFAGDLRELLMNPKVLGAGVLLLLSSILLASWSQAAVLTATVRQDSSIPGVLIKSWKYAFPLLWITSLYVGIITAGITFFVLPGLILALSLSFCFFSMADENRTGIDALLASRFYVRGHWWNTLFKLLLVWIPALFINLIPFPFVPQILTLFFTPFLMLYTARVYSDLKECAEESEPSLGLGWLWVLFGVFGFLLPLLTVIGSIVALGPQLPEIIKQVQTNANQALGRELFPQILDDSRKNPDKKPGKPPLVRQLPSINGFLVWRDPIGDTHNPLLDIKEVSAKGEQDNLILAITMIRPFSDYFLSAKPGNFDSLVSFYLDTDTNRATGGTPFKQDQRRNGYDLDVQVQLVVQQGKNTSGRAEASLYQLSTNERRSIGTLDKNAVTVSGDTVTIRVPYTQLKAASGDIIRVCYQEAAQEKGRSLAKDKLVPLK
ncbi:MAG: hypothetical protein SD837_00820 [Candidatus Electrothrix scaldis]|nr:MAG: hypothetical protein SD837_00820 [Candidatus Electrothrix sp. GW3-3]